MPLDRWRRVEKTRRNEEEMKAKNMEENFFKKRKNKERNTKT